MGKRGKPTLIWTTGLLMLLLMLPSGAAAAVPDTIFGSATPATIDSGDGNSVELGVKFSSEVAGTITGIRFYKAAANTGTHIGSLWTLERDAARVGHLHRRDRLGLAAGQLLQPRGDRRQHDLRRRLPGAQRPLLRYLLRLRNGAVTNAPPLTRSPTPSAPTASTPTAPPNTFPTSTYQSDQLLGRRRLRTRATTPSGPGHARDRDRGPGLGDRELERADERRAPTEYTITPYIGAVEPRRRPRSTGSPPATQRDDHRAEKRNHLHVHGPGVQCGRQRSGLKPLE